MLVTWPPFPIFIDYYDCSEKSMDNIIAALEHNDRVYRIYLSTKKEASILGRITQEMQKPFPQLMLEIGGG